MEREEERRDAPAVSILVLEDEEHIRTMLVDGLEKAVQGMTTLEEVLRVMDESEMEDIAG